MTPEGPSTDPAARPVAVYLPFRGTATRVSPGVLLLRATAPSSVLRTTLAADALRSEVHVDGAGEAHLEARITLLAEGTFEETGTVGFGGGAALRFRSSELGRVGASSADPSLQHGAVTCVVDAGSGWLAGASGLLASNFLVARTGELADHQLGLVFLPVAPPSRDPDPSLVDLRSHSAVRDRTSGTAPTEEREGT